MPTETAAGTVLGTAGYMSPEQVRGEPADVPSDIFSFGCVLYEMLARRRAFARETAVQTMTAILEAEPPELGGSGRQHSRRARTGGEALSGEGCAAPVSIGSRSLDRLEVRSGPCLRWGSARRPETTTAYLDGDGPGSGAGRARSVYWLNRPGQAIRTMAILPFTNVGADPNKEYLSDGITENLINSLSQLPTLRVTARSLAFRYKGPQVDPQKAGRDLHVRAVLTGRVTERDGVLNIQAELLNVDDGAQLWGGQYNRTFSEILALQEEIARKRLPGSCT